MTRDNQSPTRIIAMINQKGGVGKTTSAVNLGAALARSGQRTLLIDLDPQAHLTLHVGIDSAELDRSLYDLLADDDCAAAQIVQQVNEHLYVLPAHVNLAGIEAELAPKMVTGRAQRMLKSKVDELLAGPAGQNDLPGASPAAPGAGPFDFVLIDCPPSLGLLTINALVLAREIIVPMQAHFLALQGLSQLLETVSLITQSFNPDLSVSGVLLCMHENQTLLSQEVMADLTTFLESAREQDVPWRDAQMLRPAVRRNIKLAECPSFGKTVFDYEPDCHGAKDYQRVAAGLIDQSRKQAEVREIDSPGPPADTPPAESPSVDINIVTSALPQPSVTSD